MLLAPVVYCKLILCWRNYQQTAASFSSTTSVDQIINVSYNCTLHSMTSFQSLHCGTVSLPCNIGLIDLSGLPMNPDKTETIVTTTSGRFVRHT